jgi:hypothetical protein
MKRILKKVVWLTATVIIGNLDPVPKEWDL